jgi:competence protein ComEC
MRRVLGHRFRRTTLQLLFFISLLGGIGLARAGYGLWFGWCGFGLAFLLISYRKRTLVTLLLVVALGLGLGMWRGSIYMQKLAAYEPFYYQKITLTVRAGEDAVYGKTKQLMFSANDVVLANGQRLTGKIQLSGFGANAIFQGDEVVASGKLYPGHGAYQGRMSFAVLRVVKHHPTAVAEIRRRFVAGMQTALPEPLAPFAMGLLVGQRANLPQATKDDLQRVGLTHIIAVSGANLTIILQAVRRMLGKRSKRISTFLTLALMGVFLLLAGASAPIVRAAMVSMLSMWAAYYGRNFKPLNLITLAAVITAWANPVYLWSDLSWYLSFLAFFGIMILAPLIQARWPGRWHDSVIAGVALESLCAEILTLPFVLHIFGQMSRVGLLANVLVVAFIPLAMLLGTVAGLAGMLAGNLAGWFAWPANILLTYMLDVAHVLASLPHVFVIGIGLSLWQMLFLYGCIGWLTALLWYKNPNKSDIITDMNEPKTPGLLA